MRAKRSDSCGLRISKEVPLWLMTVESGSGMLSSAESE